MNRGLRLTARNETALAALLGRSASKIRPEEVLSGAQSLELTELLTNVGKLLVVVPENQLGEAIVRDLNFFRSDSSDSFLVSSFFHWDMLPFDALSPAPEVSAARITTLYQLLNYPKKHIVVATVRALMQQIISPDFLKHAKLEINVGDELDRERVIRVLDDGGYIRNTLCEEVGQIAVRGAVVDFFPPRERLPIRIELFGDRIESIRRFEPATQRSKETLQKCNILPVREFFVSRTPDESVRIQKLLKDRASELEISQRTVEAIYEAVDSGSVWPGLEHLLPMFDTSCSTLWDYLPENTAIVQCGEHDVRASAEDFDELVSERAKKAFEEGRLFPIKEKAYRSSEWLAENLQSRPAVLVESLSLVNTESLSKEVLEESSQSDVPEISVQPNDALHEALKLKRHAEKPLEPLAEEIKKCFAGRLQVAIVVSHEQRAERIKELLANYEINCEHSHQSYLDWVSNSQLKNSVSVLTGEIGSGFISLGERAVAILESDIFPEIKKRRAATATTKGIRRFLGDLSQLKENDYIVHIDHGVGIYRGLKQVEVAGQLGDFLELEYGAEAKLFLPVENIARVQKYVGADGKKPALSKLGGSGWEKTKKKVEKHVVDLAGALISLYAQREITQGVSYGPVDSEDLAFGDLFEYEETPDQAEAIGSVLADMERSRPMDRLVCGDVGYGKTEVAVRAAFKAVNSGKQVAVLVPTTILTSQHLETFNERFSGQPFEIAAVSRFFNSAENKETLERLSKGKVDIIIGTHRLLQKDVVFKDLGLLVIDEEHRFGVAHKEKLKQFRRDVDVLTLTATPIPRTLHMSMVGIRDLSTIETAPCDRQVIRTYMAQYEESLVREAILREIGRSGQAFYIFNRVQGIQLVRDELANLVPEARIEFAHGQMKERELEVVMKRFLNHEIDVLVSTTIVESGLDIPNANTIIIRNAHNFGLAELYQLRGRVGRSSRRAYAYLLISDPAKLGVEAKKRLKVLQSLDDLGQGFRLALQDMEIRGAGNLLGKDQSGQVMLVGFEMYSKILKEAVLEQRTRGDKHSETEEIRRPNVEPELSVGFPAHIPPFYIPDVAERLLLYQRLVELRDMEDGYTLSEEIQDRFGNMPKEVEQLVELMIFRSLLKRACVVNAVYINEQLKLSFHLEAPISPEKIFALVKGSQGALKLSPSMVLTAALPKAEVGSPLGLYRFLMGLLKEIEYPL